MLYTVIVLHYNQAQYWRNAVSSVLSQDYSELELIFADDGTQGFATDEIRDYIEQNKRGNLLRYTVLTGENVGTVRSLNRALKAAHGELLQCFAADDALYDGAVKALADAMQSSAATDILTGEYVEYEINMQAELSNTKGTATWREYARLEPLQQYARLCEACSVASGATVYRTGFLQQAGGFDEAYKLVEDWPIYLKYTRGGKGIGYVEAKILKHRAAGVSSGAVLTQGARLYYYDALMVQQNEILPFIDAIDKHNVALKRYISDEAYVSSIAAIPNRSALVQAMCKAMARKERIEHIFTRIKKLYHKNKTGAKHK